MPQAAQISCLGTNPAPTTAGKANPAPVRVTRTAPQAERCDAPSAAGSDPRMGWRDVALGGSRDGRPERVGHGTPVQGHGTPPGREPPKRGRSLDRPRPNDPRRRWGVRVRPRVVPGTSQDAPGTSQAVPARPRASQQVPASSRTVPASPSASQQVPAGLPVGPGRSPGRPRRVPVGQTWMTGMLPVSSGAGPEFAVPAARAASRTAAATVLATSGWNTLGMM